MKLKLVAVALVFVLAACKKETPSNCVVPALDLSLEDKKVLVTVQDNFNVGDYDVEYGTAGFTQGAGTTISFAGYNSQFTVTDYGSYDVYVKKKCDNGDVSSWSAKYTVNVDGSTSTCTDPVSISMVTITTPYRLVWYGDGHDFYDVEYGPTGFQIGNGTRVRTNDQQMTQAILQAGNTYDFYVRANCGGTKYSTWTGPTSVYAQTDQNINVACTDPTDLYAYKINTNEINYNAVGHGSVSYEISISQSNTTMTSNILSTSSANGTVYNPSGFNGTRYFWIRGKCVNGSFTNWAVSQVQ